jgi:hypothetical protein
MNGGPTCAAGGAGGTGSANSASCGAGQTANQTEDQQQAEAAKQKQQYLVFPDRDKDTTVSLPGNSFRQEDVYYKVFPADAKGNVTGPKDSSHEVELKEKVNSGNVSACTAPGSCKQHGTLVDTMRVLKGEDHSVEKRFTVDGKTAKVYDQSTKKSFDYVLVKASYEKGFTFEFRNDKQ